MLKSKEAGLGRYGEPATLVLLSLVSGPKHGYAIMMNVEQEMGFKLGAGTLYGAIAKLIKLGMIQGLETDERAKPY
jgi:DNA-binding PadR family transcriptional regulator